MPTPSPMIDSVRAVARLQAAWIQRDAEEALAVLSREGAGIAEPDLRRARASELLVYRQVFEAWDDLARLWWLADAEAGDLWRRVLAPDLGRGASLLANARWLRTCGSQRVDEGEPLPPPARVAEKALDEQARILGRFLVSSDASSAFDYGAWAAAVDAALVPALATWFVAVYLASPRGAFDTLVEENRERAAAAFVAFHAAERHPARVPALHPSELFDAAFEWAAQSPAAPPGLLATLQALVRPGFARIVHPERDGPLPRAAFEQDTQGVGVLFGGPGAGEIARRTLPLFEELRGEHVEVFLAGADASRELAPRCRLDGARVHELGGRDGVESAAEWARRVETERLDFLFLPAGSDSPSRLLATQRLARVQAAGLGPVTSGSPEVDYFVGASDLGPHAAEHCEQLVLLPGLGLACDDVPEPARSRERPFDDERVLLVNHQGYARWSGVALAAWTQVARELGERAELVLHPGLDERAALHEGARIVPYFDGTQTTLVPGGARGPALDSIVEADVYLDGFPCGGFERLLEVLAAGCPIVTLEDDSARGRMGAALVRRLGLPGWLVAHSPAEYVDAALRLARDAGARRDLRAALTRERVLGELRDPDLARHFQAAVAWMRERGPRPGRAGAPVVVAAGERAVAWPGRRDARSQVAL